MVKFFRNIIFILGLFCSVSANAQTGQLQPGQIWGNSTASEALASGNTVQQILNRTPLTSLAINTCTLGGNVFCTNGGASISGTLNLTAALTYGGVVLSNSVTGTGSMVLSASPTFTGTVSSGSINMSASLFVSGSLSQTIGNGNLVIFGSSTNGGIIKSQGAAFDLTIQNSFGTPVIQIPTGSLQTNFAGHLAVEGITSTGATGTGNFVFGTSPSVSGLIVTGSLTATGLVTNADLVNASTIVNGTTCTLGSTCAVTATAASVTIGTTTIVSGTNGDCIGQTLAALANYGCLRYDTSQSLTTTQQDQSRINVGIFTGGGYANIFATTTGANTISITADAVTLFNSTNNGYGVSSASLTLNMATTGANGLDSGSVTTQGYYYFVIYNPTTGTTASLASAGLSPTMPSGYTYKRRIGWLNYNSGITTFVQRNSQFTWAAPRTIATGTQLVSAFFSLAGFTSPAAARVFGFLISNNNAVQVEDNSGNIIALSQSIANQEFFQWTFTPTNTTYQVGYQSSSGGGQLSISGWEDNI